MRRPEFVYATYIETTPEKLWQALTIPPAALNIEGFDGP
jgi:uncharacterized protein YndB with AHSA1/START domain